MSNVHLHFPAGFI